MNRQDRKFNQPRRVQQRLNKQMKLPYYHQYGRLTTRPLPYSQMQRRLFSQSLMYHQLGQRAAPRIWPSTINRQQRKPDRSFKTRQQQQIRMGQQKATQKQRMQGNYNQLNQSRRSRVRIPQPISPQRGRIIPAQGNVQQRWSTSTHVNQQQRGRIIPVQGNVQQRWSTSTQVNQQQRGRIIPVQGNVQQRWSTSTQVNQQQRGRIIPAQGNVQQRSNTPSQVNQQQRGRIIPAQGNVQQRLNTPTQVNQQQRAEIRPWKDIKQQSEIVPLNQSKPQQRIRERLSALHGKKGQPRIKLVTPKELVLLAPIKDKAMWEMIVDRLPPDYSIPDPQFLQIFRSLNKLKHKF
ncbi:hypothetical protein P5G62_011690 [Neobacillus sp. 179-C4.2 HS]|uniref:Uncharacterized protein n=1 Tax=Neobacillus driksii TaxID=3035913 RepID=A0ABV4YSQ7_9BACI